MKRAWSLIFMLVLMLTLAAGVMADQVSPYASVTSTSPRMNDEPSYQPGVVPDQHRIGELDEIIGDTLIVGTTWRDMQHNATLGRMIEVGTTVENLTPIHFTWCSRSAPEAQSNAWYISATRDELGNVTLDGAPTQANVGTSFGAYQVLNLEMTSDIPILTYHGGPTGGADYFSYHATPNQFVPTIWNNYQVPTVEVITMWPHAEGEWYNGNYYVHSMLNEYIPDNFYETHLYYNRSLFDPTLNTFTNATPGGVNEALITDVAMNLSNAVAVSRDGSHVALANTVSRYDLFQEGDQTQHNNEILYWESTDGGGSWNFGTENGINITNWIGPDPDALPDTVAANGDTMRAYTEVDLVYDSDNNLHAAFNIEGYYHFQGTITYTGRIYYWNSVDQMYVQIQDGTFWNYALPDAWERIVGNANLYFDPDYDVLWCAFVQYGQPGDTTAEGTPIDASDDAYKATDIFLTASPDMGRHWAMPVNVTNTRNLGTGLLPGETDSERELSLSLNSDGDYLYMFYTDDFDPGIASPGPGVGDATLNNVVYQSISKWEMYEIFDTNAEWIRNYPMHIDSSGFYEDPDNWEYTPMWPASVPETGYGNLQPNQFELKQNYPNPFNPSTEISFDLSVPGKVKLVVYDVLGREVAVLINRGMSAGEHTVTFLGDGLASGVYFYSLTSGDITKTRKMMLMK